jgi:hypothetical protein
MLLRQGIIQSYVILVVITSSIFFSSNDFATINNVAKSDTDTQKTKQNISIQR